MSTVPPVMFATASRTAPSTLLRSDVAPLLISYALFLVLLLSWWRSVHRPPAPAPEILGGRSPSYTTLLRYVAVTAAGGYVAFLVLVGGYYAAVARQTPWFLRQAISGGAIMAAVAAPSLLALGWVEGRLRARSSSGLR